MALYFHFNETTGDLVYSDKATYGGSGYTSLGEQTNMEPSSKEDWVFGSRSQRLAIVTVSKDESIVGKIAGLKSMKNMFNNCNNITSLDLSGFDTSSVTDMSEMFSYCKFTSLDLSGLDTSSVTNMSEMFRYCNGLTSLDLSGLDTSSVTNMSEMFSYCSSLTSLDLSVLDTSSVTDMGSMFSYCSSLTSLDLSVLDTSSVTDMGIMFMDCTSLTSLDLSGLDTSSVTDMGSMFSNCSGLTSLDLSGFDTSAVKIMDDMFSYCSGLTSLDLSGFDTSSVTGMQRMFSNCSGLTSLDLSGFDTSVLGNKLNIFRNCSRLRLVTISDKMSNVLSQLPADQYYPAAGGSPVAKASLTAGTWVRDEADLTKVTSIVQQAQMSQAISRRIGNLRRDLEARIREASALLDQLDFAAGGLIPVENGGTGATSASAALASLGAASASDIDELRDSLSQRFACGAVTVPQADSYPTTYEVDSGLGGVAAVVVTPFTSVPQSVVASAQPTGGGKFNIILHRDNPASTSVGWIAMRNI